jgi:hypothetical protein
MKTPRFDINRDFSWLFFACLVVVLVLFGLLVLFAR